MPELTSARRYEITKRWTHAKALVQMCEEEGLPVACLESALGAAQEWGEGLYNLKAIQTEDEENFGRTLQAKLDSDVERTLLFRKTQAASSNPNYPYVSRHQARVGKMVADTGLNEAKRRQLLRSLCESEEPGEAPLLRHDILQGEGKKHLTASKLRSTTLEALERSELRAVQRG